VRSAIDIGSSTIESREGADMRLGSLAPLERPTDKPLMG
jgi:hypothetical protein